MQINIRKVTKLDLDTEIENDENKEYWVLLKVEPTGLKTPSNKTDLPIIETAVHDGLARIIPEDQLRTYFADRNERVQ